MALLQQSHGLNWQAAGNISACTVLDFINANYNPGWTQWDIFETEKNVLTQFTNLVSNYLNDLWDPAWNVVVVYVNTPGSNGDSVLYGYAFRQHWLWLNGYKTNDDHYVSFIVWKDYNCAGNWFDVSNSSNIHSTFSEDETAALRLKFSSYRQIGSYDDVWGTAKYIIDDMGNPSNTMVISQISDTFMYGRVCTNYYYVESTGFSTFGGNALLLQMQWRP